MSKKSAQDKKRADASIRIAVAQMTSSNDADLNFAKVQLFCKQASAGGAEILFLPEAFAFIGASPGEVAKQAQPLTGRRFLAYCSLARENSIWISFGGFQETGPDKEHLHNCHALVDSCGKLRAAYRKLHLFDVDLSSTGGPKLMESSYTAPGSEVVACDHTPVGTLGLAVCYDLRFPYVFQALRFRHGAHVLTAPSAFTRPTGTAHWHALLRARAIENQCYVVAAAQCGTHNPQGPVIRTTYGHALVVDPWGTVVLDMGADKEGVGFAEICLGELEDIRMKMPLEKHRRPVRS